MYLLHSKLLNYNPPFASSHPLKEITRGGAVSGCRAKLSHLKNDRPRVLYRARDGADETLEKESRAVRASPAFSQICGPRDRPSAYLRPGGPGGHPLPSIRLKIIDRASHVLEEVFQERGRKESRQSAVVDYRSDIVYRHWKLSRLMAWIVGRKGGRRRGGGIVESTGFERRGRGGKMTGAFPGSRKLVLTRLCRCLMRFTLSSRAQML